MSDTQSKATFGAGCFWGIEEVFRTMKGVEATTVGYIGGKTDNPTYEQVCTATTGHAEVVEVVFDADVISYTALLDIFFSHHNPTELNRQGPDVGSQYRSAVFVHDETQESTARTYIQTLTDTERYKRPIVTSIEAATTFWPAEDYHQEYLAKRGLSSCHI